MTHSSSLQTQFESSLKQLVLSRIPELLAGLREMVSYHFGWNQEVSKSGKRLRPMLMLTACQAFGFDPQRIMPAAVAMEVLHNYTLIHDDIEDQGETRHGRECLWRKYGLAHAINVGDYLSTMSHDIFCDVESTVGTETFTRAYAIFRQATLDVLHGQYLDMYFETEPEVSLSSYLEMIRLKTSRLISASLRIGAALAGCDSSTDSIMEKIGEHAGLAFQIQDDYLGIWGDTSNTGKSNLTDLTTRKKTYPILLGLIKAPAFRNAWFANSEITPELARNLTAMLSDSQVDEQTTEAVLKHISLIKDGEKELSCSHADSTADLWALVNSAFGPTFSVQKTRSE